MLVLELLMLKQKLNNMIKVRKSLSLALVIITVLVMAGTTISRVYADRFDDQINQLRQDNANKQTAKNQLGSEAISLNEKIAKLQTQIYTLQAQINANQQKSADLQKQITAAEEEMARQKKILGENIKAMYLEGQISTIEMLATSKDLSEFVDKAQYRNAVKDKIKATYDKITNLRKQLNNQKVEVENLLKDQQSMQAQLVDQQNEQSYLLSLNQDQQNQLNSAIQSNNSQIVELRKQQAIENARFNIGNFRGDPNSGGYPAVWANAPQDSLIDNWGMYNRECVSYTAWKVASTGRYMPYWGGIGNANQWDDNAIAAGIPTDYNPKPGDVAISNAGFWGHAMYVESAGTINGQSAIYVSQFNADFTGHYSEGWRYTTGLIFIHF